MVVGPEASHPRTSWRRPVLSSRTLPRGLVVQDHTPQAVATLGEPVSRLQVGSIDLGVVFQLTRLPDACVERLVSTLLARPAPGLQWLAGGFTGQGSLGTSRDLLCLGGLDHCWVVRRRLVEAREQFGGHVSPFAGWQRQSFAQNLLRAVGHRGCKLGHGSPTSGCTRRLPDLAPRSRG